MISVRYIVKDAYKTKDKKEREERIVEIVKKQIVKNK